MAIVQQKDVSVEEVTFDMIISYLNDWKNFVYEFENGDELNIYQETKNFPDIGEVKYLEVSYADHSSNLGAVDVGVQYFSPYEFNNAVMVFLERLASEDPSKKTNEEKTLESIRYSNLKTPKIIYEISKPKDQDMKKMILVSLRTHDEFIFEFKNKDILRIANIIATEREVTDVDCIAITYAEYDQELSIDKDKVYNGVTTEFFLKRDIQLAIDTFIEKMNSDNPKFITEKGKKLKDIRIYNTKILSFDNHYDYLEVMLEPFWLQVFGKTPSEMMRGGIIGAHGDKGNGYEKQWKDNEISFNRGMLIYLLTWTTEMTEEKSKSEQWVIDKYHYYLSTIEEVEKQVLKNIYEITV